MSQFELPMKPDMIDVDSRALDRLPDMTSALVLCKDLGGIEPKQLVPEIVKDAETWSLIQGRKGRFFPHDKMSVFMHRCQNEAPLFWLARRHGYDLVPRESELERQVRLQRERAEAAEKENALLRKLVTGRVA